MIPRLDNASQDLLRDLAPAVLGALLRRYRDFGGCEDAVQEALLAGAMQWPAQGVPDNPKGWLITVATRRLTDQIRSDTARRLREHLVVSLIPADEQIARAADAAGVNERDETLDLYFMCCHAALSQASQIALTLRAVGGLTTGEIARAFLVPEGTMAQRLTRAKHTIKSAGQNFPELTAHDRAARLPIVLKVLYLIFNEGYTASEGDTLSRPDLSNEAIRVARQLSRLLPDQPEVGGLLALMLLTDARRAARTGPNGELIPLDEQVRSLWNRGRIGEGKQILERSLAQGAVGPYQVQAAIAALHDEAPSIEATDWPQILALYDQLQFNDNPMARLSRAIALAMVNGPAAGLAALDELAVDPRLSNHHRLAAARAHLLERAARHAEAIDEYRRAAERTANTPERNYLLLRAARLSDSLARIAHQVPYTTEEREQYPVTIRGLR
jgi:RNA polymerase sigma factor (sigma-70 family)